MHHPYLLAVAGAVLVVGILLVRWASRYDPAGIATDAAWRMVKTRSTSGAREELGKVIDEQLREARADTERIGLGRTAIKHGGRFFVARFVNLAGIVLIVVGIAAGAAAFLLS